jgi:hypothetical protein
MVAVESLPPVWRGVAIAVMAIAMTTATGWYLSPISHPDSPSVPAQVITGSGVANAASAPGIALTVESPTPDGVMAAPSAPTAAIGSGITSRQRPAIDLAATFQQAQTDLGSMPAPLPPGVVSWQGMTQEQAAKAFESAVQEYSRSITANPFRSEIGKN